MTARPRIAVILDENTSGDGRRYEAAKGYFQGVHLAGGLPFGIPFLPEMVDVVLRDFDGVLAAGGRFAYPDEWYVGGLSSKASPSERLQVERAIAEGCLDGDKPILGICAGMQMIACVSGSRMSADLRRSHPHAIEHDRRDYSHPVDIEPGSRLYALVGAPSLLVNSLHREAVVELGKGVAATARARDGVVEAVEIAGRRFAMGLQWHQEAFVGADHPGNAVFRGLVDAC